VFYFLYACKALSSVAQKFFLEVAEADAFKLFVSLTRYV